jgi:hypothetical protein
MDQSLKYQMKIVIGMKMKVCRGVTTEKEVMKTVENEDLNQTLHKSLSQLKPR